MRYDPATPPGTDPEGPEAKNLQERPVLPSLAAPVTMPRHGEQLNQDVHRGRKSQGQTHSGLRASKQKGNWPSVRTQALGR